MTKGPGYDEHGNNVTLFPFNGAPRRGQSSEVKPHMTIGCFFYTSKSWFACNMAHVEPKHVRDSESWIHFEWEELPEFVRMQAMLMELE